MLDHLPFLSFQAPPITKEHFSRWKQDPCTLLLKQQLVSELVRELDNPLPKTFDETIICVHQREGAMAVLSEIMNWQPALVEEADEN